jgi:hypothetical protein
MIAKRSDFDENEHAATRPMLPESVQPGSLGSLAGLEAPNDRTNN